MKRTILIIGATLALTGAIVIGVLVSTPRRSTGADWQAVSLAGALQSVTLRTGKSQVALNKQVTYQQLSSAGFQLPAELAGDQFQLIIRKGDYDVRSMAPGFDESPPAKYVAFVYDQVNPGVPTMIVPDSTGAVVQKALGDSSLPQLQEKFAQPQQQLHPQSPNEPPKTLPAGPAAP